MEDKPWRQIRVGTYDNTGNVTQYGQQDVDEEVGATTTLLPSKSYDQRLPKPKFWRKVEGGKNLPQGRLREGGGGWRGLFRGRGGSRQPAAFLECQQFEQSGGGGNRLREVGGRVRMGGRLCSGVGCRPSNCLHGQSGVQLLWRRGGARS